jgi:hypothetical protein
MGADDSGRYGRGLEGHRKVISWRIYAAAACAMSWSVRCALTRQIREQPAAVVAEVGCGPLLQEAVPVVLQVAGERRPQVRNFLAPQSDSIPMMDSSPFTEPAL